MEAKLIQSKIKLTIGILVSNRMEYIRQCMEALKPLLDAVPSELIAVDTKGAETDGSIDVVREYTDKIYPFTWCGDFAAARNITMEHASGEWYMFLDDDEVFDDVQEFIDFFQNGECEHYLSGYYYTKNYASDGGEAMYLAWRMVRRWTDTCFFGKIHEQFNKRYAPGKIFQSFVHHYGYCYKTKAEEKAHHSRNLTILQKELEEKGMAPHICAQMAQELFSQEETRGEGFRFCTQSIQQLEQTGIDWKNSYCGQWLLLAKMRYYNMGSYDAVMDMVRYTKEHYLLSQASEMVMAAVVIETALPAKKYEAVMEYVDIYFERRKWLKAHPDDYLEQMQGDFPGYDTEGCVWSVLAAGAMASNGLGKFEEAYSYWEQLPWKDRKFDGSTYAKELVNTLCHLKDKEPLIQYYRYFYKDEFFCSGKEGYLPKEYRDAGSF